MKTPFEQWQEFDRHVLDPKTDEATRRAFEKTFYTGFFFAMELANQLVKAGDLTAAITLQALREDVRSLLMGGTPETQATQHETEKDDTSAFLDAIEDLNKRLESEDEQ